MLDNPPKSKDSKDNFLMKKISINALRIQTIVM